MRIRVEAPGAREVRLVAPGQESRLLAPVGDAWVGDVVDGDHYGLIVDDGDRTLVDPNATAVHFSPDHDRDAARPGRGPNHGIAPLAVARPWPAVRPARRTGRPLVVSELHVRGATKRRPRPEAGTLVGLIPELQRLASLGVSVIELLPVHQFDPDEGNYWGYMALVFGAVHQQYAAGDDANRELGDLVAAAHDHGIEVWLDVVFNHTTEEDELGPTYNLRGLADRRYYVRDGDGAYVDEAGCGNIIDTDAPIAREVIMRSLQRFADLGVDGFRFDLATILARNPEFVREIGDWAEERGIRLVAEAWDVVRYHVGRAWPDQRWMQWNGRYRDDMRGFLRGEGGLIPSVIQRLQGSPDLFDDPTRSINFFTAHDGFTLYDLVAYDNKHNDANGWAGTDGTDDNRSWNCGWEGDDGASDQVVALRRRQLRNAWALLMLSHGVPMFVAGDEFARTQGGNNNAYNQDNETSWIDWDRRDQWTGLEAFVRRIIAFRSDHPVLFQPEWWAHDVEWFGAAGGPDLAGHSRSIAWHLPGLYVMANMWWEPLEFAVQAAGPWRLAIDTATEDGFVDRPELVSESVTLGPRSIVVLTAAPSA
jgi:glycogen operon protein